MSNDAIVAPLMRVQLFQGLSPRQLGAIARRAERIMYRPGALITEEGDAADAAVLIVAGETERVSAGMREPVEPGSLIGETAMLIDHVYGATVVARGPVRALRLTRAMMHDLMRVDPTLAEHLVARISARLSVMLEDMRSVDTWLGGHESRLSRGIEALTRSQTVDPSAAPELSYATH